MRDADATRGSELSRGSGGARGREPRASSASQVHATVRPLRLSCKLRLEF